MYLETESNTLHNTDDDAKINIERRTPLEILNCEEMNHSRIKCHKRRQNTDRGNHVNFDIIFASVIFLNKAK